MIFRIASPTALYFFLHIFFVHPLIGQDSLKIGWSEVDITPDRPVLIAGQFHARVSEGVLDPVTATVLVLESGSDPGTSEKVIFVSCDLVSISDGTRDEKSKSLLHTVRQLVTEQVTGIEENDIILNATHSHSAPYCGTETDIKNRYGVDLDAMSPYEYLEYIAGRIAGGVIEAWTNREVGGISYGISHAVVGRNRLQASFVGSSRMYGNTNHPDFSHIEGYEDHSVNLIYTWEADERLTGIVMNVACPSQVSETEYRLSADYWHDVRKELRFHLGYDLALLAQCSAAGDQSPHLMYDQAADERMQRLLFPDERFGHGTIARRKQIARDLARAAISIYPAMRENILWNPRMEQKTETVHLTRRLLSPNDLADARAGVEHWKSIYDSLALDLNSHPEKRQEERWYRNITQAYGRYRWFSNVEDRYRLEQNERTIPIEIHTIRLDEIAIATNPFELYLDYGIQIKAQSPALQTFLVQLAGGGSYLPTERSINGGAYGAVASSTLIGPEGGRELVGETLRMIASMWADSASK